nr:putative reverse transcriptase domain-containing protein [Tanacetum cinerariifolium]
MGRNENMSGSVFVPSSEEIEPYEEGETAANDQRAPKESHKTVTCFECGKQRNYKKDCPKLKNRGRENSEARGRVYELGENNANPDSNVVTSTFLLNNRYASILFDTGVDRSFMSTTFSFLINIIPFTLDHSHGVELADGKIIGVNTIIRGCTLVKDKQEKDKIGTKPDRKREAWKCPARSKPSHSRESRKEKKYRLKGSILANPRS